MEESRRVLETYFLIAFLVAVTKMNGWMKKACGFGLKKYENHTSVALVSLFYNMMIVFVIILFRS